MWRFPSSPYWRFLEAQYTVSLMSLHQPLKIERKTMLMNPCPLRDQHCQSMGMLWGVPMKQLDHWQYRHSTSLSARPGAPPTLLMHQKTLVLTSTGALDIPLCSIRPVPPQTSPSILQYTFRLPLTPIGGSLPPQALFDKLSVPTGTH